jgi:hypothetical protein
VFLVYVIGFSIVAADDSSVFKYADESGDGGNKSPLPTQDKKHNILNKTVCA